MTSGSKAVKHTAKTVLKNNFLSVMFSCSIFLFTFFIILYLSYFLGVVLGVIASDVLFISLSVLVTFPLLLGVFRFVWRLLLDAKDTPIAIFYYFCGKEEYLKSLRFFLKVFAKCIIPAVFFFIPSLTVQVIVNGKIFEWLDVSIPLWTANLEYVYLFLRSLAYILLIIYVLKYYLAPYLIVSDENMDIDEVLNMSKIISRKTMVDFIYLFFSFALWIFLSVLVIPLIFTLPYFLTSYAVHYRYAVADYNKHIEESKCEEFPTYVAGA